MYNEISLHKVADIKLGLAFKSAINDVGLIGRCYLIQTKDIIQDGSIEFDGLSRVIPKGQAEPHFLEIDDIILRLRGPIFSASIIDRKIDLPIITTNQSAVIRCKKEKISPYYLHWYLNSFHGQRYFDGISEGTNINKISAKIISDMTLNLPSMSDQLKIGDINRNWLNQKHIYTRLINNGNQFFSEICNKLQNGQV